MKKVELLLQHGIDLDSATLMINGEIDEDRYEQLQYGVKLLKSVAPTRPMIIELSTYGGDLYFGLAMYDYIRAHAPDCTIVCGGPVMSAGSLILQAGKTRWMYPNAYVMVHFGMEVNTDQQTKAQNEAMTRRCKEILIERCTVNPKTVKQWFKKESYFNATRAVNVGLVDGVYNG